MNKAPSQAAIGRAMSLSPSAVTKLKRQGMPVHSVEAAVAWRLARQNIAQRKPIPPELAQVAPSPVVLPSPVANRRGVQSVPASESHDAARTRREIAEAHIAELKLAEQCGELVDVQAIRLALGRRLVALRESLLQIPARVAPILAVEAEQARCHAVVEDELHAVLRQVTDPAEDLLGVSR